MRTFATEDNRKTKLFDAWIEYLNEIHSQYNEGDFEEIFEGMVDVTKISEEFFDVKLEDGQKLRDIPVTQEISAHSLKKDKMYIILGLNGEQWVPIDVVSITSIIKSRNDGLHEMHLSFNPLMVDAINSRRFSVPSFNSFYPH